MRSLVLKMFFLLTLIPIFLGCGGGGGGSSSGIRVLHGSIDAAPYDLYSSSSDALLVRARFASPTEYVNLVEEPQVVSLFQAFSKQGALLSQNVEISGGTKLSLLVFGDGQQIGRSAKIFVDAVPEEITAGRAAVRVIHALNGAGAVNVRVGNESVSSGLVFGAASAYQEVAAGNATVRVERTVDFQPAASVNVTLEEGKPYTLFVTGEVDFLTLVRLLVD
ncbi:MAG: DUF4397 domain-containing protein [Bdellovibrionales bacterium]|nr:DUF4397 domain-containing protein [Bdellovibrionales bacterium]